MLGARVRAGSGIVSGTRRVSNIPKLAIFPPKLAISLPTGLFSCQIDYLLPKLVILPLNLR